LWLDNDSTDRKTVVTYFPTKHCLEISLKSGALFSCGNRLWTAEFSGLVFIINKTGEGNKHNTNNTK
jgi:hypothetical protein